jgi:hypothetical protein
MAEKGGGGGEDLLRLLMATGLMGGGQTHEQIQYNKESQVLVQVLQALALVVATCAMIGGLFLMGGGLLWVVRAAETVWDLLLVAAPGAMVMMGVRGISIRIQARLGAMEIDEEGDQQTRRMTALAAMMEAVASIGMVLALLVVVQALDEAGRWSWTDWARPILGLGLVVSGSLLVWRFTNELFNPLFPKSPTTQILERLVAAMEEGKGPENVVEVRGPYPWRPNGQVARPMLPATELPAGGGEVEVRLSEDYKLFVDLVALVQRAQTHGLTRAANVDNQRPRLRLPSGERLTRDRLEMLWAYGAEVWGLWMYEAERGRTPEWAMELDAALELLRAAWERQEGQARRAAPAPTVDSEAGI